MPPHFSQELSQIEDFTNSAQWSEFLKNRENPGSKGAQLLGAS
jgi:hypothetical protein